MIRTCARCGREFYLGDDLFLTCYECRKPAPKKRKQGGSKVGRKLEKKLGEDNNPGFDNIVRAWDE